jgi:hypothetical protein
LILPAVLYGLARSTSPENRTRALLRFLLVVGVCTLGTYILIWQFAANDVGLLDWMLQVTHHEGRSWALHSYPRAADIGVHVSALGVAVVGLHTLASTTPSIVAGIGFILGILVAAWFLRGRGSEKAVLVSALVIAMIPRFPFYLWFEPQNWEWWLPTMVFVVAIGAQWLRGPSIGLVSLRIGTFIILAMTIGILLMHGPTTLRLRERNLAETQQRLAAVAGAAPPMVYLTYGDTSHMAFHVRGIQHDTEFLSGTPEESVKRIVKLRAENPDAAFAIFFDRFVQDGQPVTIEAKDDALAPLLDGIDESDPKMRVFRRKGRVFALGFNLPK